MQKLLDKSEKHSMLHGPANFTGVEEQNDNRRGSCRHVVCAACWQLMTQTFQTAM